MAGDIKRQRKSWTLQDRSKVSINILRANLAEEGDEDAQLDVAKRLLQESSGAEVPETTKNENARLAIYWLIKSSEQGNEEATHLLRECLQSGSGLTAQNILDVRTCVTTPKHEKLTFKAARELHRKLSNGEDFITTAQLLARVNFMMNQRNVTFDELSNGHVLHDQDQDEVEEEQVVSAQDSSQDGEHDHPNSTDSRTCGSATDNDQSTEKPEILTAPESTPHPLLKDIRLNETFVVSSQKNNKWNTNMRPSSTSPNANNFTPTLSSSPKYGEISPSPRNQRSLNVDISNQSQMDLKLAMVQSGKKLTLQDLLNVAKDFNNGRVPEVSIDENNRMMERHQWEWRSLPNTFLLQLLLLSVVVNATDMMDVFGWIVPFVILWSVYNLYLWKSRYQNFQEWRSAFKSVLKDTSWDTSSFSRRLSNRYLRPHLLILSVSGLLLSYFDVNHTLCIFVGILSVISIQFGVFHRYLPTWQQILILSLSIIRYASNTSLATQLLGNQITGQIRFLHEPLITLNPVSESVYAPVTITLTPFPILVGICLLFTITITDFKLNLDQFMSELVLTLWLIKTVKVCEECKIAELYGGIVVGVIFGFGGILIASRMEIWKVVFGVMVTIIITIFAAAFLLLESNHSNNWSNTGSTSFLEWEEYDANCHRRAWTAITPAATQLKCSTLYEDAHVRWKGKISIVKVEKISRKFNSEVFNVVFDIGINILPERNREGAASAGGSFWGSASTDKTETNVPASLIVETNGKKALIDHILNFKSGDIIEFEGRLKRSTAGGLKPQIVGVRKISCQSCQIADEKDVIFEEGQVWNFKWLMIAMQTDNEESFSMITSRRINKSFTKYKNFVTEFIKMVRTFIVK